MLKDRLAGQVQNEDKTGPKPYLDQSEEKKFGEFCNSALQLSMGRHADVMAIAQSFASLKGVLRNERIRQGWFHSIPWKAWKLGTEMQRQYYSQQDECHEHKKVKQYFELLEDTLKELDLVSRPTQVYNVDETEMPLDPKALNVIAERDVKKIQYS